MLLLGKAFGSHEGKADEELVAVETSRDAASLKDVC